MSNETLSKKESQTRPEWLHPDWLKRLIQVVLIMAIVFTAMFVLVTKANARQCVAGSEVDTCPNIAAFQAKYANGFFKHANGVPDRVLNTPGQDHDAFVTKFVNYYNNHPGQQHDLGVHGRSLDGQFKIRQIAQRDRIGQARREAAARGVHLTRAQASKRAINCGSGETPQCWGSLFWAEMMTRTTCMGWHTYPNLNAPASCDRGRQPCDFGACEQGLTAKQFVDGLIITSCAAGAIGAIGVAIGSAGAAAPFAWMAAGGAAGGCGAAAAEIATN